MRQLFFGSIAAATLIALGGAAYAWQAVQYRNVPGPVTGTYAGGIKGTFGLEAVTSGGMASPGTGGACLIFRARDLGYSKMEKIHCSVDSQCSTSENSVGYCDQPNNKCWAKPIGSDPTVCKKGLTLAVGITHSLPVSNASLKALKIPKNAKVRVLSRLNCAGGAACAPSGATFVHQWGDPKQL